MLFPRALLILSATSQALSHLPKTGGAQFKRGLTFSCQLSVPRPLIHSLRLNCGLEPCWSHSASGGSLLWAAGAVGHAQDPKASGSRASWHPGAFALLCLFLSIPVEKMSGTTGKRAFLEQLPIRNAVSLRLKRFEDNMPAPYRRNI